MASAESWDKKKKNQQQEETAFLITIQIDLFH